MSEKKALRLAIPNGSLQEPTVDLFCRAGYNMKVGGAPTTPSLPMMKLNACWSVLRNSRAMFRMGSSTLV